MKHANPTIGGNWKMNTDLASARALAGEIAAGLGAVGADVTIFPPFPYLLAVADTLSSVRSPVRLGAQDFHTSPGGAFTGEVSLPMLRDCGVSAVLAGHSERRHIFGETDGLINAKVLAALAAGFDCTLCIGETLGQRRAGKTDEVNARQLRAGLSGVAGIHLARLTIAYEPVWAIGTGKTASAADAQDAHAKARAEVARLYSSEIAEGVRIQYGGSVKASNAAELFAQPDIDGALVGGASLDAGEFVRIVRAAGAAKLHP